jgi:hypothetical protein
MNTQAVLKARNHFSFLNLARISWLALAALILFASVKAAPFFLAQQMQVCPVDSSQCA